MKRSEMKELIKDTLHNLSYFARTQEEQAEALLNVIEEAGMTPPNYSIVRTRVRKSYSTGNIIGSSTGPVFRSGWEPEDV